jgi:hypothetical protein
MIDEDHAVDLLIFTLTAIISQAIETELTDDEFDIDIDTMLKYFFELIISIVYY